MKFSKVNYCIKRVKVDICCYQDEDKEEDDDAMSGGRKRKKIRKILNKKGLSQKTVDAAKAEEERRERIAERQKLVSCMQVCLSSSSVFLCPICTSL